jgi:hypothetical protein
LRISASSREGDNNAGQQELLHVLLPVLHRFRWLVDGAQQVITCAADNDDCWNSPEQ